MYKKRVLLIILLIISIGKTKAHPTLKHHGGQSGIILLYSPWKAMTTGVSAYYNWSRNSGIEFGAQLRPKSREAFIDFEDNFTVVGEMKIFHSFFDIKELLFFGIGTGIDLGVKIADLNFEIEADIVPLSWFSIFARSGISIPLWKERGKVYFTITTGVKLNIF